MSPANSPFAPLPAPGPHPVPAELRAYAAGTLPPADEHRIENHTLDCERCADLLTGFSMSDAATTDRAVAELRTRLHARLSSETPVPVAGGWGWPRVAAAAALVAAIGGGIWTWEHGTMPAAIPQETAAPAPAAAAADAALAPPPPPTVAAAPAAPSAVKSSPDYAAVLPPPPPTRYPLGNATPVQADAEMADYTVLSDKAVAAGQVSAEAAPPMASPPVATPPPASVIMAEAAAQVTKDEKASADSVLPAQAMALARRAPKPAAKAMTADAASVANTPMPTVPALNPYPVGGTPALRDYLRREASQFVPEINNLRISGTVHLRFVVEADGRLSNLKITRSVRQDYDDEALRLVCEGPTWQPGVAGGKRAPLPVEVTVPF